MPKRRAAFTYAIPSIHVKARMARFAEDMDETTPDNPRHSGVPNSPEVPTTTFGVQVSGWVALVLTLTPAGLIALAGVIAERASDRVPDSVRTLVMWGFIGFVPALLGLAWASLHASIAGVRAPLPTRLGVAGLGISLLSVLAIILIALRNPPFR